MDLFTFNYPKLEMKINVLLMLTLCVKRPLTCILTDYSMEVN